jgi:hypothetical protein
MVDITATGEENLFNEEDIEDLVSSDLKFRSKQLKRLQDEVIDLEDMDEGISLSDFSLDDFRIDLMNYLKANEEELRNAPLGLYAIAPSPHNPFWQNKQLVLPDTKDIIRPGVIFCFKHFEDGQEYERLNPLHPYFLVYIRNDGTVRYHFSNAKQILEIYRLLASEQDKAVSELCDLFDSETNDGDKMDEYNELVKKAMADIANTLGKRLNLQLQNSRSAIIPTKKKDTNFELITWLIIK